jgi:hypothetical protein
MMAWWWLDAPSKVIAHLPVPMARKFWVMGNGSGPIVPSGFTPPGIGWAVPTTAPPGVVNQNETASPPVKPVAVNVMVVPTVPYGGEAAPLTLCEVSHETVCAIALPGDSAANPITDASPRPKNTPKNR